MKHIVLCCDGTWNSPDQAHPTNVILTARTVMPRTPGGIAQVVYYDSGVGTFDRVDRFFGGAFGRGLERNVVEAFRFLVHNYEPGDRVYLFGFSRGAYTARSTAGLIRQAGILKKREAHRVQEAYDLYRRSDVRPGDPEPTAYRARYSHDPWIHFIGVWDTVGARGIPLRAFQWWNRKYQFHDVELSSRVRNAFHALAIDERRAPFRPAVWQQTAGAEQRVEQVWFAGAHSNIGGGYPDAGLSHCAFLWMRDRAAECGLAFDDQWVSEHIRPDCHATLYQSRRYVYRLLRAFEREIGATTGGQESVHPDVVRRTRERSLQYAPRNLMSYLNRPDHRIWQRR